MFDKVKRGGLVGAIQRRITKKQLVYSGRKWNQSSSIRSAGSDAAACETNLCRRLVAERRARAQTLNILS